MTTLKIGRIAAVLLSLGTFAFLFPTDSWRADNLFLVPDLILCAALLVAAALPGRIAVPALLAADGFSAGVLLTAVASYAVYGRIGIGSLIGSASALIMAVVFLRALPTSRRDPPSAGRRHTHRRPRRPARRHRRRHAPRLLRSLRPGGRLVSYGFLSTDALPGPAPPTPMERPAERPSRRLLPAQHERTPAPGPHPDNPGKASS